MRAMTTLVGNTLDNTLVNLTNDKLNDLYGLLGRDTITGNDHVDYIYGQEGDDILNGGGGNDWLFGGRGADALNGGSGIDTASYYDALGLTVALDGSLTNSGDALGDTFSSVENLIGTLTHDDTLAGDDGANHIWGLGGDDTIYGRGGADSLSGEAGDDTLSGEDGNDWLFGGKGADRLHGGDGRDGASYRDSTGVTVSLDDPTDGTGEAKGDVFNSIESLDGSAKGDDVLSGNAANNSIWGNGGDDELHGKAGSDKLFGGTGSDQIFGDAGDDTLTGGGGKDLLNGGQGNDTASYRSSGGVTLSLDGSLDAKGAAAGDTLTSIEYLSGSERASDRLAGDEGDNALWGYGGSDHLFGRAGDDFLFGGKGHDVLTGGAGNDVFVFDAPGNGSDVIRDFTDGDFFELTASDFDGITGDVLKAAQFQTGSDHDANSASVRVIYDSSSNSVWYDADGNGEGAAVKLASFSNDYVLKLTDIVLA